MSEQKTSLLPVLIIDKSGKSNVGCRWNDVVGERAPDFEYPLKGCPGSDVVIFWPIFNLPSDDA